MSGTKRGGTPRTLAEWVSLSTSLLLLAGVVGVITWMWVAEPQGPARFTVERGAARQEAGLFHLPVAVTNTGGESAAQVRVEGRQADERPATTIDFLPVGAREELLLVFRSDPSRASVEVVSYQRP